MNGDNLPQLFELGVKNYFKNFGHRLAREITHQGWLAHCLSQVIDPQLVVSELNAPNRDLSPFANIKSTGGAVSFDFAITRSQIDLRTWKSRTPGWNRGELTTPHTLETLSQVAVLAELKVMDSSSTTTAKIGIDIQKLLAATKFLQHHGCMDLPACFMIVFDPNKLLADGGLLLQLNANGQWGGPGLKVLIGPESTAGLKP
ncbi:MAG: hypothetical protein ACE37H_13905 [Phycisphaeraceae bacterium]